MSRKVAIYARVSTEHEAQISALENQVQYYAELLERHPEFELYDRYIDEGITGTSIKKRPSFLRMMEDAKKGCFDLIITREVSRFARNTVDTLQETRKLKRMGVEVWFTEDNIWTRDDSDGELKLTIMATLAQNESKKTSMRVKAGQMISFKNGVPYGNGNILGYDKLPNHGEYVINPEQAETVRMIYDLYLSGLGLRAIGYELEKRGRKTATGKTKWDSAVIGRTIKNAFYCGIVVYRKQYVPDYLEQKKINNHGEVETITVKGTHEPIISEETYFRAMEIIEKKTNHIDDKHSKGVRAHADVWGNKLRCKCGNKLNRIKYYTTKDGPRNYAYQCSYQCHNGSINQRLKKGLSIEGCCDSQFLQGWKLEAQASEIFKSFFANKKEVRNFVNDMFNSKNIIEKKRLEIAKEIETINDKISACSKKLDKLIEMRLNDEIDRDTYQRKRAEYEGLVEDYKKAMASLTNYEDAETAIDKRARQMMEIIEASDTYDFTKVPQEIIEGFVDKIVVYKDYVEWYLRFYDGKPIKGQISGGKKKHKVSINNVTTPSDEGSTGCHRQQVIFD